MIRVGDLVIIEGDVALVLEVGKPIFDLNPDSLCTVLVSVSGEKVKRFMSRMQKANS